MILIYNRSGINCGILGDSRKKEKQSTIGMIHGIYTIDTGRTL